MKILCDAPGQTCNRLWSYVATIAECVAKKKHMMILFFDYTIDDYPNFKNCRFIYFPLYQKWFLNKKNGWNKFKGLTWKATHNIKLDKIYFFFGAYKGWNTKTNTTYIAEAKSEIIHIFTPRKEIVDEATTLINEIRKKSDIIIGVHIRQGDYKEWNNGRFFFSLEQYHQFMIRVKTLYSTKNVSFFICSDENVSINCFTRCICYSHNKSTTPTLDLYTLSLCDKIIGPFSTFSRWASFYGNTPLCFLENVNQQFTENSFSPIVDFFHFYNGKEIFNW